jgi:hypothetical protein
MFPGSRSPEQHYLFKFQAISPEPEGAGILDPLRQPVDTNLAELDQRLRRTSVGVGGRFGNGDIGQALPHNFAIRTGQLQVSILAGFIPGAQADIAFETAVVFAAQHQFAGLMSR